MSTLAVLGRIFIGIAFAAFGVLHVAHGDLVTRVAPGWPDWMPGQAFWAWLTGALLIGAGAAIVSGTRTVVVATTLGVLLVLSFVLLGLPMAAADSAWGGLWTVAGKVIALAGGALLVAQSAAFGTPSPTGLNPLRSVGRSADGLTRLWSLGPWCFGAFLTLCGIQHFIHDAFVATLVPAWIFGAMFWTYAAGVALIAGGIGVVVRRTARLAGLLSGAMIFIWFIVLHIPRALDAATRGTNETTAVFEALAMSGIGLLIASGPRVRRSDTAAGTRARDSVGPTMRETPSGRRVRRTP